MSSAVVPIAPSDAITRPDLLAHAATLGRHDIAPHLVLLADEFVRIASGERRFVIVSMPPRHGKTEQVSRWGVAWLLGMRPDWRVILASYEATFAATHGLAARDNLAQTGEWWAAMHGAPLTIDPTFSARNAWRVANHPQGGMMTTGVGGPMTGKGANVLVIDDPVKNAEEAYSAVVRESHWQWWQTTARTRLEPGGSALLVMTRWHEDDLAGRLLAQPGGDAWEEIRIAAVCDDATRDPLGRAEGDALWPERYPADELDRIRSAVGSVAWQALYQGRPTAAGGDVFLRKWWQTYHHAPREFDVVYASWDMAFKGTDASDYVVGQVWGRKGGRFYLVDQVRARMTFTQTCVAVEALDDAHPQIAAHLVEDKANGPAIIDALREKVPGIVAVEPDGSKEARARAVAPLVEAGNVYVPSPDRHPWVVAFLDECASFPRGTNDDQVDAMSQALRRLHRGAPQTAAAVR